MHSPSHPATPRDFGSGSYDCVRWARHLRTAAAFLALLGLSSGAARSAHAEAFLLPAALADGSDRTTVTLLPGGDVLFTGGSDTAHRYSPQTNTWAVSSPRFAHFKGQTATVLQDGRVLIAGGTTLASNCDAIAGAEVFSFVSTSASYWSTTGSLVTARTDHTATLLPNGKVLVLGGVAAECNGGFDSPVSPSAELFNPSTGMWSGTPSVVAPLPQGRWGHTATLLPADASHPLGQVLVTGGQIGKALGHATALTADVELYDPATNIWSASVPLPPGAGTFAHTATLLPGNGSQYEVLFVGGFDILGNFKRSVLTYSLPVAGGPATWTFKAPLIQVRTGHSATLLPSGQVFVAEGMGVSGPQTSAEIYDPAQDSWHRVGSDENEFQIARGAPIAALLPSGEVIVGSYPELYDPAGSEMRTAAPTSARSRHVAATLLDGRVLIAGGLGTGGGHLASATLFMSTGPTSNMWPQVGTAPETLLDATATVLADGKVLVVGGYPNHSVSYVYDPNAPLGSSWSTSSALQADPGVSSQNRGGMTATLLASGQVLVVGGSNGNGFRFGSVQLYDPSSRTWSNSDRFPEDRPNTAPGRVSHTATLLPNARVLVFGGTDDKGVALGSGQIYLQGAAPGARWLGRIANPNGGLDGPPPRSSHAATLLGNGQVLITGGLDGSNKPLSDAWLYSQGTGPSLGTFTQATSFASARHSHTATLLPTGQVVIAGGRGSGSSVLASVEIYDPISNSWSPGTSLATARFVHTASLLPSGQLLFVGGDSGAGAIAGAEVYTRQLGFVDPTWRPVLTPFPQNPPKTIYLNELLSLTGQGLTGFSEASGSTARNSATNYVLVLVRRVDNGQQVWLKDDSLAAATPSSSTLVALNGPQGIVTGPAFVTAYTNGIPSTAQGCVIGKRSVRWTVSADRAPVTRQPFVLLAVSSLSPDDDPLTGKVQFTNNGANLGSPVDVDGYAARLEVTLDSAGPASFSATYLGDDLTEPGSSEAAYNVTVTTIPGVPALPVTAAWLLTLGLVLLGGGLIRRRESPQ